MCQTRLAGTPRDSKSEKAAIDLEGERFWEEKIAQILIARKVFRCFETCEFLVLSKKKINVAESEDHKLY